ncbi:MAG: histidine phosphatase family protein [bacterium]|nr:histidine phosphatase family protein [bacterium]
MTGESGSELPPKETLVLKRPLSVWVYRHGESDYEGDNLTERGREQAREAGISIFGMIPDGEVVKFLHSPKSRAQETAEIMLETFRRKTQESNSSTKIMPLSRKRQELTAANFTPEYLEMAHEEGASIDDLLPYWYENNDPKKQVEMPEEVKKRLSDFLLKLGKVASRLPDGPKLNYILISHSEVPGPFLREAFRKKGLPPCGWVRFDFESGKGEKVKMQTFDKKESDLSL